MDMGLAPTDVMDPMYWLGEGGLFGGAVLAGVMVIVFIETGLLFPLSPGDTLLFSAGLIAAQPNSPVSIQVLAPCAALAALLGSQCGYFIGRRLGPALFKKEDARFFKQRYLTASRDFFDRHGPKTLLIAQFIGVVRTFTPVIAGMSGMRYPIFLLYNAIGSAAWGVGLTIVGYFLGNIAFVGEHLDIIILIIAILSTLPAAATAAKVYLEKRRAVTENG